MTHWALDNIKDCKRVGVGDRFTLPDGYSGRVAATHLVLQTVANRKVLLRRLGFRGATFTKRENKAVEETCSRIYGYDAGSGDCPEYHSGDMAAAPAC